MRSSMLVLWLCAACSPAEVNVDPTDAGSGGGSAGGTAGGTAGGSGGGSSSTGGGTSATGGGMAATRDGGYEGFGAVTRGAHGSPTGFTVCHVTSLANSGPGTLRDCVSASGRHVVFDVGGTITLTQHLLVPHSYLTIDGDTAPAPGITILQPNGITTAIEASGSRGAAHDIIIRNLRMDGQATAHTGTGDIWGLDGEAAPVYNVIIDHVTARACADGVFDLWEDVHDVTISWNLITDTITALHLSTNDLNHQRRRISFHHNVFAKNNERQIRLRHANREIDFVNNVVYGWRWIESGGYGLRVVFDPNETTTSVNIIGNVFHWVSGVGSAAEGIIIDPGIPQADVYFEGNQVHANETDVLRSAAAPVPISAAATVTRFPAAALQDEVLPYVGMSRPNAAETALLSEIRTALP